MSHFWNLSEKICLLENLEFAVYAIDMNTVKRQLEIVTTFSKDIGMKFEEDKCVFLHIERE